MNEKPVGKTLEASLQKLQKTISGISPKIEGSFEKKELERLVSKLRMEWNAPLRHVSNTAIKEGPWERALAHIESLIGTGMLVALAGNRGTGKTQLAVELMRHATGNGKSALFTSAIGFFMDIKATYRKDAMKDEGEVLLKFAKPMLLVIDEIGKRSDSEWENNLLFELINRRYNALKDTVLIDNRSKQECEVSLGDSLVSRLNETGGILNCVWPSFR
jgi:DNA replication protein DnaC